MSSVDSLLPWSETILAHLEWWQNPANVMKGADLHPEDHSIQVFTDTSNGGWGADLEQVFTKVCSQTGKKVVISTGIRISGYPDPECLPESEITYPSTRI